MYYKPEELLESNAIIFQLTALQLNIRRILSVLRWEETTNRNHTSWCQERTNKTNMTNNRCPSLENMKEEILKKKKKIRNISIMKKEKSKQPRLYQT